MNVSTSNIAYEKSLLRKLIFFVGVFFNIFPVMCLLSLSTRLFSDRNLSTGLGAATEANCCVMLH